MGQEGPGRGPAPWVCSFERLHRTQCLHGHRAWFPAMMPPSWNVCFLRTLRELPESSFPLPKMCCVHYWHVWCLVVPFLGTLENGRVPLANQTAVFPIAMSSKVLATVIPRTLSVCPPYTWFRCHVFPLCSSPGWWVHPAHTQILALFCFFPLATFDGKD